MDKFESIEEIRNSIEQQELELEGIRELLSELDKNKDVQEYKRLLNNSKEVYNYIIYSNKERNVKVRIGYERAREREFIRNNCSHSTLLITTLDADSIVNGGKETFFCTCLDCGKKKLANLSKTVVYLTSNFDYDDVDNIKNRYQELVKSGQVDDERLVIVNNVSRKVKSKIKRI